MYAEKHGAYFELEFERIFDKKSFERCRIRRFHTDESMVSSKNLQNSNFEVYVTFSSD